MQVPNVTSARSYSSAVNKQSPSFQSIDRTAVLQILQRFPANKNSNNICYGLIKRFSCLEGGGKFDKIHASLEIENLGSISWWKKLFGSTTHNLFLTLTHDKHTQKIKLDMNAPVYKVFKRVDQAATKLLEK